MSCRAFFLAVTGLAVLCAAQASYHELGSSSLQIGRKIGTTQRALTATVLHGLRYPRPSVSCENVSAFEASRETAAKTVPFDLEHVSEAQRRFLKVIEILALRLAARVCD